MQVRAERTSRSHGAIAAIARVCSRRRLEVRYARGIAIAIGINVVIVGVGWAWFAFWRWSGLAAVLGDSTAVLGLLGIVIVGMIGASVLAGKMAPAGRA